MRIESILKSINFIDPNPNIITATSNPANTINSLNINNPRPVKQILNPPILKGLEVELLKEKATTGRKPMLRKDGMLNHDYRSKPKVYGLTKIIYTI